MKRIISGILMVVLVGTILLGMLAPASAASEKESTARSIGIVFDNSGSMYVGENSKAWCRATYAIEVFAAMLNEGDKLSVYPMHPITIGGKNYDMNHPVQILGPEQASVLREIYTPKAEDTPIETIDAAYTNLKTASGEKWLIVLTDGTTFYENGFELRHNTPEKLDERLGKYAQEMNVLYLGIGASAAMPDNVQSGAYRFIADKATNSDEVLTRLTTMCNLIFGRDTLPESHFSGQNMNLDVSIGKLIVFVQGEDVTDVLVSDEQGNCVGEKLSAYETRFAETGSGNYGGMVDSTLQGMVVTYTDCAAGDYKLTYSGDASSIEVYYEPDVDLAFTFTDDRGLPVDPNALYEGNYSVSFGMKDSCSGEYTTSSLLGTTWYSGHYYINGQEYSIESSEKSGSCVVPLKMGDSFSADMSATYLSGYEIRKDGTDFGWPGTGLSVAARPAGNLELRISGGDEIYHLATIENGTPFLAEVYYEGELLTGDALEKTELTWDPDLSGALLQKDFKEDHYEIILSHKDPENPQATPLGEFNFQITALYTPEGSTETSSNPVNFTYEIDDSAIGIEVYLTASQNYYQASKLDESGEIYVDLTSFDAPLTDEQLSQVSLRIDCGGLQYETEMLPGESAYLIRLKGNDGVKPGTYDISCSALVEDEIGRTGEDQDETTVKIGLWPLWLKWLVFLAILLLLILLIVMILRIKALPKHINAGKRDSNMYFDEEDVTQNAQFKVTLDGQRLTVMSNYAGKKCGIQADVRPAKGSYLKTPQAKRGIEVFGDKIRKQGNANIQEATIGTARYVFNEETRNLERVPQNSKPFTIKNGARVSFNGMMQSNGEPRSFSVATKLNFKKK